MGLDETGIQVQGVVSKCPPPYLNLRIRPLKIIKSLKIKNPEFSSDWCYKSL